VRDIELMPLKRYTLKMLILGIDRRHLMNNDLPAASAGNCPVGLGLY
jgi:hypothetical protein